MNPFLPAVGATLTGISVHFVSDSQLQKIFTDRGLSSKMKNSDPLNLFTIQRALRIAENGNLDEYRDVFLWGLWAESLLNWGFSIQTQSAVLDT
jgi:hypothetical protein